MLKIASVLLSFLCGFNFVLASAILVAVIFLKKNAPMLFIVFDRSEISVLDPKVKMAVNSLGILFNASAAGFYLLSLFVILVRLRHGQAWAFWALVITGGLIQTCGFVADSVIGNWEYKAFLHERTIVRLLDQGFV
jgi:hypothetical protein